MCVGIEKIMSIALANSTLSCVEKGGLYLNLHEGIFATSSGGGRGGWEGEDKRIEDLMTTTFTDLSFY